MSAVAMPGPYKAKGHRIVTDTPVECAVAKVNVAPGTGFNAEEVGEMRSEEMATSRLLAASWDLREALLGLLASPRSKKSIAAAHTAIQKAGGRP